MGCVFGAVLWYTRTQRRMAIRLVVIDFSFYWIQYFFNMLHSLPSKIQLENQTYDDGTGTATSCKAFEFYNIYGKSRGTTPFPWISDIRYERVGLCKYLYITLTEEAYQQRRASYGILGCFVRRRRCYPMSDEDAERMIADFERYSEIDERV